MAAGRFLPLLLPLLSLPVPPCQARPGPDGSALSAPPQPQRRSDHIDASYAEHCAAPRVTGPCRAAFPRWFYSPANGTCQEFIYGGCRGNKNNFQTPEECLSRCHPPGGDAAGAHFPSAIGLALGFLLLLLLVGYVMKVTLKNCWRKGEPPELGVPWSHRKDKEYLMSDADAI